MTVQPPGVEGQPLDRWRRGAVARRPSLEGSAGLGSSSFAEEQVEIECVRLRKVKEEFKAGRKPGESRLTPAACGEAASLRKPGRIPAHRAASSAITSFMTAPP